MPSESSKDLKLRLLVSLVLMLVFAAGGIGGFSLLLSLRKAPEQTGVRRPRTVVRTETARVQTYRELLSGYGRARAMRSAEVAAEVAGLVEWVADHLEAGEAVQSADVLVRLDRRQFEQARAAAAARKEQADSSVARLEENLRSLERRLAVARSDHETARRELQRIEALAETDIFSKSELDRQKITTGLREREVLEFEWQDLAAREDMVRAKAEIDAAVADLARADLDLARTEIHAPHTGRIEARHLSPGARVAPGTALFAIVDLARVEIPVALAASRYGEVTVGARAEVSVPGGGAPIWSGVVRRIAPTVNERDRTFLVYLEVEGTPLEAPVPPGAFVLARIEGRLHESVIPIPRIAFVEDRLYVAEPADDDEAIVRERTPQVSRLLPEIALVSGGVQPGERIIVTNLEQIADGSRVALVRDVDELPAAGVSDTTAASPVVAESHEQ